MNAVKTPTATYVAETWFETDYHIILLTVETIRTAVTVTVPVIILLVNCLCKEHDKHDCCTILRAVSGYTVVDATMNRLHCCLLSVLRTDYSTQQ